MDLNSFLIGLGAGFIIGAGGSVVIALILSRLGVNKIINEALGGGKSAPAIPFSTAQAIHGGIPERPRYPGVKYADRSDPAPSYDQMHEPIPMASEKGLGKSAVALRMNELLNPEPTYNPPPGVPKIQGAYEVNTLPGFSEADLQAELERRRAPPTPPPSPKISLGDMTTDELMAELGRRAQEKGEAARRSP